jgi:hypothetical protein
VADICCPCFNRVEEEKKQALLSVAPQCRCPIVSAPYQHRSLQADTAISLTRATLILFPRLFPFGFLFFLFCVCPIEFFLFVLRLSY